VVGFDRHALVLKTHGCVFFEEVELNLEASELLIERAHLLFLLSQLFRRRAKDFGERCLGHLLPGADLRLGQLTPLGTADQASCAL
jgi:hypothetical protein